MNTNGLFVVLLVALLVAVASRAAAAEPELYATIKLGKEMASDAEFSADGKRLAYIQAGEKIVLWDVTKKEATVLSETEGLYGLVWSSDGKCLYAICFSAVYRVDAVTGERTKLYVHDEEKVGEATAIKYIPEKKQLVSGCYGGGGSIVVWDAEKDKLVKKLKCPEKGGGNRPPTRAGHFQTGSHRGHLHAPPGQARYNHRSRCIVCGRLNGRHVHHRGRPRQSSA